MPFDVIAFSEATPGTGTVGVAADSGDTLYRCSGDDIDIKPRINYLLGVLYAVESTPGYCRVKQPSHDYYIELLEAALMTPLAVTCSATNADAVRTLQFPDKFNDLRGRPFASPNLPSSHSSAVSSGIGP